MCSKGLSSAGCEGKKRDVKVTLRNVVGADWRKCVSFATFISSRRNASVSALIDRKIIRIT